MRQKRPFAIAVFAAALLSLPLVSDPTPQPESNRRMAALLARIFDDQDWHTDPNKPLARAEYYRDLLKRPLDVRTELLARRDLAEHLLVAGDSAAAAAELETLRRFLKDKGIVPQPAFDRQVRQLLAIAYLRAGEQQNCLQNHNAQSCVYPIRDGGVHRDKTGAESAVAEYTALLEREPGDLMARWLLNIAYMTVGRHPAAVPKQWLIPDSILPNEFDIGRFQDVAANAGLTAATHSGGSVAEDFDGDGLFDLVVSSSGPRDPLRYFHNNGDGTFTDQSSAAGLDGINGGLNVIHADFDNDGWPDLLVLRGGWWGSHGKYPPSLLRNNGPDARGQITFTDVTERAGLLSLHPTQTAAWADYDNDGRLDLFLGHESSAAETHPSQLFHNNGDGTFTDVALPLGLADMGFVKGVAWGDYNNDGRPDLYVSRKGAPNILLRNDGPDQTGRTPWKFTDVTAAAGVSEPVHSFATWFFDYDNDGWLDLLVTGYYTETLADIPAFHLGLPNKAETPRLYRNQRDGTFRDVTKEVRLDRVILSMGAGCGDLDNDGWLDCYFGTGTPEYQALLPNRMFRNDAGQRFQDVTTPGGFGQLQKGHAVSFADFDRDGDQDLFEVIGGAFPGDSYMSALLENPGHGRHWIGLKLEGKPSNRSAIGARVRIEAGGRSIYRTVNSGTSFGDAPFEIHAGLGDANTVDAVEIRWPSGRLQRLSGLAIDKSYRLTEGANKPEEQRLKRFSFRREAVPHAAHH